MRKQPPIKTARLAAAKLEQDGDYDGARQQFAALIGSLLFDHPSDRLDPLSIYTNLGRLYVADALRDDQTEPRAGLMANAARMLLHAEEVFSAVDPAQVPLFPPQAVNSTSPRISWLNAGAHAYRWLADLHTLAAINPELNWDGRDDHANSSDAYSQAAVDAARPPLTNVVKAVTFCIKAMRNARLIEDDARQAAWEARAHEMADLGHVSSANQRDALVRELETIPGVSTFTGASNALLLDVGAPAHSISLIAQRG